jgi:hypothetical protein
MSDQRTALVVLHLPLLAFSCFFHIPCLIKFLVVSIHDHVACSLLVQGRSCPWFTTFCRSQKKGQSMFDQCSAFVVRTTPSSCSSPDAFSFSYSFMSYSHTLLVHDSPLVPSWSCFLSIQSSVLVRWKSCGANGKPMKLKHTVVRGHQQLWTSHFTVHRFTNRLDR